MDSDDSAPEDVPIGFSPVNDMFNKRLTAKKLQQDKKLKSMKKNIAKEPKPLPLEVLDQLSAEIPDTILPLEKLKKKAKKKKAKGQKKAVKPEVQTYELKKLPDFISLDDVPESCSTKFKVGVLDAIVKNPITKNHKEYILFHSKKAQGSRRTNVKDSIVKRTLIKRLNAAR